MSGWQESQKEATPTSLHGMIRYKLEDQDHGDPQLNFPQEQVPTAKELPKGRKLDMQMSRRELVARTVIQIPAFLQGTRNPWLKKS
ncbi:MAG: hypothetical protein CL912_09760 [Deltaproteobacteria bacterium]|nr:hypothetical protein [Deltaproteobacteria bacterium]